jgi:hypothetical protein
LQFLKKNSDEIVEVIEKLIGKAVGDESSLPSHDNKMGFSELSSSFPPGQIVLQCMLLLVRSSLTFFSLMKYQLDTEFYILIGTEASNCSGIFSEQLAAH